MTETSITPIASTGENSPIVKGKTRWIALISLLLLAACLPEFLTGSTYVSVAFTHPFGFALLVGLYGGGSLFIREITLSWKKKWASIFLLGAAYGIGEEGFATKTMLDPTGSNIGTAGLYSHWMGINWVPLSSLTLFHSFFSIAFQLLLLELIFPQVRGRHLLSKAGTVITGIFYCLTVFSLSRAEPYVPLLSAVIILSALVCVYIGLAYFVPGDLFRPKTEFRDRSEFSFVLSGATFMGIFFLIFALGPHFLPWPITASLFIILPVPCLLYLLGHIGEKNNERAKIGFAIGVIAIFVPLDILNELKGDIGVIAVPIFVLVLLLYLRQKTGSNKSGTLPL